MADLKSVKGGKIAKKSSASRKSVGLSSEGSLIKLTRDYSSPPTKSPGDPRGARPSASQSPLQGNIPSRSLPKQSTPRSARKSLDDPSSTTRKHASRDGTPASKTPSSKRRKGASISLDAAHKRSIDSADSPTQVSQAEKRQLGIGVAIQKDEHAYVDDPEFAHWTQPERDLFNQFADRGAIPLMPKSWKLDFSTMPEDLFTDEEGKAFIDTYGGKDFQAQKALNNLLSTGTQVRDRLIVGADPTIVLQRAVYAFEKWCMVDGLLENRRYRPIFAAVATEKHETTADSVTRITDQFCEMASEYINQVRGRAYGLRDPQMLKKEMEEDSDGRWQPRGNVRLTPSEAKFFQESRAPSYRTRPGFIEEGRPYDPGHEVVKGGERAVPTLFGVIIAKSVLAVVSYDCASWPAAETKTIALFDFSDDGQDVWNAFALAILLVTVRNTLVELASDQADEVVSSDPDA